MNKLLLLSVALSSLAGAAQGASADAAATVGTNSGLEALFQQADFWQGKQRQDLAKDALNRVLIADPNNAEALYRLAVIAIQEGDKGRIKQYSDALRKVAPNDSRLEELRIAEASNNLDSGALNEARLLAANGQYADAIKRYQSLFSGAVPPVSLAPEYYQTLAGTDGGWSAAKDGLAKLHSSQPNSGAISRAYGEVLTYQEASRRQGIALLASLPAGNSDVAKAWRNAMLWLDASSADRQLYLDYAKAYPGDQAVEDYYRQKTTLTAGQQAARSRADGYNALKANQLGEAEKAFGQALAMDRNDAESRAGLGLVQLRHKQFDAAKSSLGQAMKMAPAQRKQWQEAYDSANFYANLQQAQYLEQQGQYRNALQLLQPLTQRSDSKARDARLLLADVLQKAGQLDDAAVIYRQLLQNNNGDTSARVGLINVLRQQQRWDEATQLSAQLPDNARAELGDMATSQALLLRARAATEPPAVAEASLRQALVLAPENPWVRLDLARLLNNSGRSLAAQVLISRGVDEYGTADDRYVAALLAQEQQRWDDVSSQLAMIPVANRNAAMVSLAETAALKARLAEIKRRQAIGDKEGARALIITLYQHPPKSAAAVGDVAAALYDAGEPSLAVSLVRQHGNDTANAPVADYLGQILVLQKAGDSGSADELIATLSQRQDLSSADWKAIDDIRNAMAVVKADQLRKKDNLAEAYDVLAARLKLAPEDDSLLLAMARVYQSGEKPKKALQIYRYTLKHNPDSDEALSGGVDAAISAGELGTAEELVATALLDDNKAKQPAVLLLAAKVAKAQGNNSKAMELLAQAKSALQGDQQEQPWVANGPGEMGNPFAPADVQTAQAEASDANPWRRPNWLPGSDNADAVQLSWDEHQPVAEPSLSMQIAALSNDIQRQDASYFQSTLDFSTRDGEAGLGKLDKVENKLALNIGMGASRLEISATPTFLNGGTLGNGFDRFGSGMLADGAGQASQTLDNAKDVLDDIETTAYAYEAAQTVAEAAATDDSVTPTELAVYQAAASQAERTFEQAAQQDLLEAMGLTTSTLTADEQTLLANYLQQYLGVSSLTLDSSSVEAFLSSREALETLLDQMQTQLNSLSRLAQNPEAQHDAGIALGLAYQWRSLGLDIGTTPLGFAQTNIVGGLQWQPQLTQYLRMDLNAERRAVTDSVLSYAGTTDPVTGEAWGGVTRSGLKFGLGYDDGQMGIYGDLGGYFYSGTRVDDNQAFNLSVGGYVRPINSATRQLQTGVHVTFETFDKNMNHFSLGHGGYFSPQDFVTIAFPLSYSEKYDDFNYKVSVAPGYQSYTEKAVDYFPRDAQLQQLLELMTELGLTDAAQYAANSKSGFGLSFGAEGEYRFTPTFSLGGKLGFDNFGNYNETNLMLYLKYLMGVSNE